MPLTHRCTSIFLVQSDGNYWSNARIWGSRSESIRFQHLHQTIPLQQAPGKLFGSFNRNAREQCVLGWHCFIGNLVVFCNPCQLP